VRNLKEDARTGWRGRRIFLFVRNRSTGAIRLLY
jgi:hypothetical protein